MDKFHNFYWLEREKGKMGVLYVKQIIVQFQVLTAVSMKVAVFWVIAPCSLVEVYRHFRCACCLYLALMMEVASTSEMLVNFYQTTRRNNLEASHLQSTSCFAHIFSYQVWDYLGNIIIWFALVPSLLHKYGNDKWKCIWSKVTSWKDKTVSSTHSSSSSEWFILGILLTYSWKIRVPLKLGPHMNTKF
jgi:hypothetical protein